MNTNQRPSTIEEAVRYLLSTMPETAKRELAALKENELYRTHYGLAAGIRNDVLHQNPVLCKATGHRHPDDASSEIVRVLWTQLQ